MRADLSRVLFDPDRHFSAVVAQQGRVQLESEINEQTAILLHYVRTLAADLIGPSGCPDAVGGFEVKTEQGSFTITPGRMYVGGILCETSGAEYWTQPDGFLDQHDDPPLPDGPFVVYLRVWERLITAVEDPSIREIALGLHGPDTTARAKVVWQLGWFTPPGAPPTTPEAAEKALKAWLDESFAPEPALAARARRPVVGGPCDPTADAGFHGPENQLYRVEIYHGGPLGEATWVWSRENGSVALPIVSVHGTRIEVADLGRDDKLGVEPGDMVELVDDAVACRSADDHELAPAPRLFRVTEVDHTTRHVVLDADPAAGPHRFAGVGTDPTRHPFLRRWDHRQPFGAAAVPPPDGALLVQEDVWLPLEDGIEIRFEPPAANAQPHRYRRGAYWQIPARVVTGDVEWPAARDHSPAPRPPRGVRYHYAPLALVDAAPASGPRAAHSLRRLFNSLA